MKKWIFGFVLALIFIFFFILNQSLFVMSGTINLLVFKFQAPMWLIILVIVVLFTFPFVLGLITTTVAARNKERKLRNELENTRIAVVDAVGQGRIDGTGSDKGFAGEIEKKVEKATEKVVDRIEGGEDKINKEPHNQKKAIS
jgi:membrane protein implicated in regulation of membrane protease activity